MGAEPHFLHTSWCESHQAITPALRVAVTRRKPQGSTQLPVAGRARSPRQHTQWDHTVAQLRLAKGGLSPSL